MPTEKKIASPELLYKFFEQYVIDCKENPKEENFYSHKEGGQVSVDREIPLTWNGFDIWLRKNKIVAKLEDYKANSKGNYSEYSEIIHAIGQEIYEDKFTGAVTGIYKENIIARELGLSEKSEKKVKVITSQSANKFLDMVVDLGKKALNKQEWEEKKRLKALEDEKGK